MDIKTILIVILMGWCNLAYSENWFYGQARMSIDGADLDAVRELTIKNAISDASYRAGATISSEEIVLDGVLVGSKVILQTQGYLRRAEVLSEDISNGVLTVNVRADILVDEGCRKTKYGKRLLVSQFVLMDPKQAALGQLFDIGTHVTKRMQLQLNSHIEQLNAHLINQSFDLNDANSGFQWPELVRNSEYLEREYGHQYALFGVIRDLSLFTQTKDKIFSKQTKTRRSLTIRIYLLDTFSQNIILEQSYHAEADWSFSLNDPVDLQSSLFWQSDFGMAIANTLGNAAIDIDDAIKCSKSYAQIIAPTDSGFIINLGASHGVQVGDILNLNKRVSEYSGRILSKPYISHQKDSEFKVISLNSETSVIYPVKIGASLSARVFDFMSSAEQKH